MATDFQMPTATHHHLYTRSTHSISPTSSTPTTPQASSPTSPHSTLNLSAHSRPLRPQNPPVYVPAALRPSYAPRRKPSPPSSFDSPPLSRTNSDSVNWHKPSPSDWSVKDLGELPSRDHWKPDSSASVCDALACTRTFTYFTRRHHCRRCGNIFCDLHSAHLVPLDANASLHPAGRPSRACDFCWGEYTGWEAARGSRAGSRSGSDDGSEGMPATPGIDCARGGYFDAKDAAKGLPGRAGMPGSVAASVPRDWNWSTF